MDMPVFLREENIVYAGHHLYFPNLFIDNDSVKITEVVET